MIQRKKEKKNEGGREKCGKNSTNKMATMAQKSAAKLRQVSYPSPRPESRGNN